MEPIGQARSLWVERQSVHLIGRTDGWRGEGQRRGSAEADRAGGGGAEGENGIKDSLGCHRLAQRLVWTRSDRVRGWGRPGPVEVRDVVPTNADVAPGGDEELHRRDIAERAPCAAVSLERDLVGSEDGGVGDDVRVEGGEPKRGRELGERRGVEVVVHRVGRVVVVVNGFDGGAGGGEETEPSADRAPVAGLLREGGGRLVEQVLELELEADLARGRRWVERRLPAVLVGRLLTYERRVG